MGVNEIDLSIIIPVYNCQHYLSKCLDSIIKQEQFDSCEIILINDCSTDESENVCKRYLKYRNIQLNNNTLNVGPGVSRNIGMKMAKGRYIYFVDGDDFIDTTALKYIFECIKLNKYDYIFVNHNTVDEFGELQDIRPKNNFYDVEYNLFMEKTLKKSIRYPVWKFVINRDFIYENNIIFPNAYLAEDALFIWKVLSLTEDMTFITENLYYYRIDINDSLMKTVAVDPKKTVKNLSVIINEAYLFYNKLLERKNNIMQVELQEEYFRTFVNEYLQNIICLDEILVDRNTAKCIENISSSLRKNKSELFIKISSVGLKSALITFKKEVNIRINKACKEKRKILIIPYSRNISSLIQAIEKNRNIDVDIVDNLLGKNADQIKTLDKAIKEWKRPFFIVSHRKDGVMNSIKKQLEEKDLIEHIDFIIIR